MQLTIYANKVSVILIYSMECYSSAIWLFFSYYHMCTTHYFLPISIHYILLFLEIKWKLLLSLITDVMPDMLHLLRQQYFSN